MTSAVGGPGVRRASSGWGWVLASGILGILVGVVALFFPGLAILTAAFVLCQAALKPMLKQRGGRIDDLGPLDVVGPRRSGGREGQGGGQHARRGDRVTRPGYGLASRSTTVHGGAAVYARARFLASRRS